MYTVIIPEYSENRRGNHKFPRRCYRFIYTPRSISRKLLPLGVVKGFSGSDKPDRADGDKVVGVLLAAPDVLGIIFVDYIRHQPEIMLDKAASGFGVAAGYSGDALLLFLWCELPRERYSGIEVKSDK